MSYRRTWLLVDAMNRCWERPPVETAAGGTRGGGAHLSELGVSILAQYRSLKDFARQAEAGEAWSALRATLRDHPHASQHDG